jgi:thioredoxin 1
LKGKIMASPHVAEFTDTNWQQEVVASNIPVVVDFWAPWCGPCKALTPTIEKLAAKYAGQVKIGKLNVDDGQQTAAKFGVTSIPRVFIFKGSDKPVWSVTGLVSENELTKAIDSALQAK